MGPRIDVSDYAHSASLFVEYPRYTDIDEHGPRLDVLHLDEPRDTNRGNDNVRPANVLLNVAGARVTERHRGIDTAPREHQANGATDGDAASEYAYVPACQFYAVGVEEGEHPAGSAGQWSGDVTPNMQHQFPRL